MADQNDPKSTWNPIYTLILSGIVAVGYALLVWYVIWGQHGTYSVEGTRLLLVLTLTIAMFGFGGLLIARSLFADKNDDKFQDRFRLAREIFLVFSGIFGTIIGFYFGTSDTEDRGTGPTVEIVYADGQLTATVNGGAGPFVGIITKQGDAAGEAMTANERKLTYAVTPCPQDASVLVVDGRGRRVEGTVKCDTDASSDAGDIQTPEDGNAADQNTSTGDNVANTD